VYLVPQDELPINIVIPYDNMKRGFSNNKVFKVYDKCNLKEKNIPIEEITDTLKRASELIEPYRGFLAKRNFYIKLALGISGAVFLILAVMTGMLDQGNYWGPMLIVILYLVIMMVVITAFKYRSSYQMRMSQFLLSVFCRAENNRFYLKHGVEVRPGFTGKWIEFTCLPNTQVDDIIQQMRQRFLKPCMEQKAAIFDKEIMA